MAREALPAADPTVSLREAAATDAYSLWLWANDVESRRASHGREPIPWSEHFAWFETRLKDSGTVFFVAEAESRKPVGSIRFETTDEWSTARLSYVVAPEARGLGLARAIVTAGCDELRKRRGVARIVADTLRANPRSVRVFSSLKWVEKDNGSIITFEYPSPAGGK
jgi:RimJ/RimL family protein N-acetyltransferase